MQQLTDEERKKLVDYLRQTVWPRCDEAANEIERLAKDLEESRKKELKFRIKEPEPWVIRDD